MDRRFVIDTGENKEYMKALGMELLEFGKLFPSQSGASYYLGDDGKPWTDRPRETWITCRMAHVYSMAAMAGFPEGRELAAAAIRGLSGELKDKNAGGWYAGITADGQALPDKQCYAHAFVILASSSAVLAGIEGAEELLEEALKVYDEKFWDENEGLAVDTWDTGFTVLDDYRGLNANMHTVEAFLAAADCLSDEKYRQRAGRIIDRVISWAADNRWRIPEHFTKNWEADLDYNKDKPDDPFKPYGATPGHGIEWSRLISQWAMSTALTKERRAHYTDAAVKLYERAVEDAWNADGACGLVYTTDWDGKAVVHDRMHWTLAEAINTSAVLYRITNEKKYAEHYSMFSEYLEDVVHDHVHGSWFHQLDRNNKLLGTVWPGKSDIYHAFQATQIPYLDVDRSIAYSMSRKDVLALGELLIDFTCNGESEQGNMLFEANPGGAPCNVLAMLTRLGKRTGFIGKVGDDQFGRLLRSTLDEVGIDSRYLMTDEDVPTTLAFVHKLADGDREFSFYRKPGADMMLGVDDIKESMFNTKIFHFGTLSMTHENVRSATMKAVEIAKKKGCLISLDPNLREPLWADLEEAKTQMLKAISCCDILKISDNEIQFVTGMEDYDQGIQKLRDMYEIPLICLTMGKDGSRGYYKDLRVEVPAVRQSRIVDATGAGDTFCGSVLGYICDNGLDDLTETDLKEMLSQANAAASLVTQKKGAIRSMPDIEDIRKLRTS